MNVSDHQPDEEAHDIVHDLQGQVPMAQGSIDSMQVTGAVNEPDMSDQYGRRRSQSNTQIGKGSGYRSRENEGIGSLKDIDEMRFSNVDAGEDVEEFSYPDRQVRQVVGYVVNMEASYQEFNSHIYECNLDFKENIIRQVQTMKLRDTSELN